jgi:DNA-binding CsgD family transcriptional regulator
MTFSMRESQILDHLQDGQTNKQIGANLGISPNTVRDHIRRMMLRTGVCSRVSLATLWLRQAAAPIPLQAAPERRSGDRRVVPTTAAPPTNVVIHM